MLLCILTGGNVDLSVGATLCLVGAIAAQLMSNTSLNAVLVIIICLAISAVIGTCLLYTSCRNCWACVTGSMS